jgi:inhibitor of KinA sporulation pathway (predicted exonuclease)
MSRTKYDKMVIVDLEATCWDKEPPKDQFMEVIEIGVALLDLKTFDIEVLPEMFVRPTHSTISDFCTNLTSITSEMVANAPTLEERLRELRPIFKNRVWASWGDYDRNQLQREADKKGFKLTVGRTHVNLKSEFARYQRLDKECGLDAALGLFNMQFMPPPGVAKGTAHRGNHDAYNIARITAKNMGEFSISP